MPLPHGFVSRQQWKFFYSQPRLRALAHKEANKVIAERGKVTGYRSLPRRTNLIKGRRTGR